MFYRLRHKVLGYAMLAWLSLTIIGLAVGAVVWQSLGSNVNAAFDSARFGHALDNLLLSLQDAETGERGFLLTASESYLEPFTRAEQNLPGQFNDLARMTSHNQVLQSSLLELRGLAELQMASLKEGIQSRRRNGPDTAELLANLAKNKTNMENIRTITARMHGQGQASFSDVGIATRRQLVRNQLIVKPIN